MKRLKAKLISATALLVLSAVMMTTASFAWFTISTNPEIANIQTKVTANGNLEIALDAGTHNTPGASTTVDAGKNETWGNLVDLQGFFKDATNGDTVILKPVQFLYTTAGVVTINKPVYGLDGRVAELKALKRVQAKDSTVTGDFTDLGGVWVYTDKADVADAAVNAQIAGAYDPAIYAFEVDFWLRTNAENSTVSLTTAVSRAEDAEDTIAGEDGLGSYITDEKNITILFQDGTNWYMAKRDYDHVDEDEDEDGIKYYPLSLVSCKINASTGAITVDEEPVTSIALTANTAKEIRMFVFMDGTSLTNADALLTITEATMNIQFTSSASLVSMDVPMTGYGRK